MRALFHGVDQPPADPPDASDWARDLHEIVHHRLSGLALAAAESDGVHLDAETEAHLRWTRDADTMRSLAVEAAAPEAIERLRERGVPSVVIKGPAIARIYPVPSLRPFRDIDILIPPDRFDLARRTLGDLGFHWLPDRERPRRYYHRRCQEAVNLYRDDGACIDLHHRIPPWIWGSNLAFGDVKARSRPLALAGGTVPSADPVHNLIIAGLHVISDGGRPGQTLLIWRDLATLAGACPVQEVAAEARRVRLDWCLGMVVRELPGAVRPNELVRALGEARPGRWHAFRLRHVLPPAVGSRHLLGQAFRLPIPNAMAFMAGYVLPSQAFLRHRYGSGWAYGRWWREAFGRFREAQNVP